MGFLSKLYEAMGLDEKDVKKYQNKYKNTGTGAVVEKEEKPKKKDKPKKQDKPETANNGSGDSSSGGSANSNKNTVTINKPPSPTKNAVIAADDPLAAYCDDLAKQKQEKSLQTLWGMTGADDIWGRKDSPKVATVAETLRTWGLGNTTAQEAAPAVDDGAADYQRLGAGALVDTADKADSDPLALLKNKWQQGQEQIGQYQQSGTGAIYQPQDFGNLFRSPGGGVVPEDEIDFPVWADEDGVTTLPTYGQLLQYYKDGGVDKEGSTSTENYGDQSYLGKSLNQILLGNYTDDVTALGTVGQVALGILGLDLPGDIRDLTYDITNWQSTPEHVRQTVLDAIGVIPGVGAVKYADELGTVAKGFGKNVDELGALIKGFGKNTDEAAEGVGEIFTKGSQIPDYVLKTKPLNSPVAADWLNNGGKISIENGTWKYTNPQGASVSYINGFPDFKGSGHVVQEVDIGGFRNRTADSRVADKLAPNGPKSSVSSWHHHEDGKTLQEVNRNLHRIFTHRGGISDMKKRSE